MEIVIVSNDASELDELDALLRESFPVCRITRFTDPFQTAKYLYDNRADLVLAAEQLKPPSGTQLMRVLRAHDPQLPVVILSEDDALRQSARDAGADGFIVKPVTRQKLTELSELLASA